MKLCTPQQMQNIDRRAIEGMGIPGLDLMEAAGSRVAETILKHFGDFSGKVVTVVCGKGNNGGDGFVVARHLSQAGVDVQVFFIGPPVELSKDARLNYDRSVDLKLKLHEIKSYDDLPRSIECDLVVDAVFGTGFTGSPHGLAAEMISYINELQATVVAVDLPSGLNADTGQYEGADRKSTRLNSSHT